MPLVSKPETENNLLRNALQGRPFLLSVRRRPSHPNLDAFSLSVLPFLVFSCFHCFSPLPFRSGVARNVNWGSVSSSPPSLFLSSLPFLFLPSLYSPLLFLLLSSYPFPSLKSRTPLKSSWGLGKCCELPIGIWGEPQTKLIRCIFALKDEIW